MLVLRTWLRDDLGMFFNPPYRLAQPPAQGMVRFLVNDTTQRHLDRKRASGVNDWWEHDSTGKVGGGKYADAGLVRAWRDRSLNPQRVCKFDGLARRSCRMDVEVVRRRAQVGECGGRELPREEV